MQTVKSKDIILATKENDVKKQILDWFSYKKVWAVKINTGATIAEYKGKKRFFRYGAKGMPDILARMKPIGYSGFSGRVVWVECKSKTGRQTEAQKEWQLKANLHGDLYILARSLADVQAVFE
jgi:hypothetical protein